jgi:cell division protein YceG involved in septum cleavage
MNKTAKILIIFLITIMFGLVGLLYYSQFNFNKDINAVQEKNKSLQKQVQIEQDEKKKLRSSTANNQEQFNKLTVTQQQLIQELEDYLELENKSLQNDGNSIKISEKSDPKGLLSSRKQLELEITSLKEIITEIEIANVEQPSKK